MKRKALLSPLFAVSFLASFAPAWEASAQDRAEALALRRTPVVDVFEKARDAVVNISSTEIIVVRSRSPFDSFFEDMFDFPSRGRERQFTRTSVGSGFVIHPDGYIITNAHVISRTAERKAIFADGREYEAQVVAVSPERDLAVLKIEANGSLPTLPLGRSNDLMIGETVIAIGNPLEYGHTVTSGVVSALDRSIAVSPEVNFDGLIQTDASINPGNSGGPLLNVLGELIGINTAIRGDAQNIGFAIPVDRLREELPELLDVERRYQIRTGLSIDSFNEPRVTDVLVDSPADEAGIRAGDVLVAVDDKPVHEGIDFNIALINRDPGDRVRLRLRRGSDEYRTSLQLDLRPAPNGEELAMKRLGLQIVEMPRESRMKLGLDPSTGLLISDVSPDGPADEAGVQVRDVLIAVGRHYVSSVADLGQLLDQVPAGETTSVSVLRLEPRGKVVRTGPIRVR